MRFLGVSCENATRAVMRLSKIRLSLPTANGKPRALGFQPGLGRDGSARDSPSVPWKQQNQSIAAGGLSDLELAPGGPFKLQAWLK